MSKKRVEMKHLFRFRRLYPMPNEVGVEVELEGSDLPGGLHKWWQVKGDGSLRGHGVEYVLSQPSIRGNEVHRKVRWLYGQLPRVGPSDRCGVHVHLNCQELTTFEVFNIITLYLLMEDALVHWCGEDREGNLFCLRTQDAGWLLASLIEDKYNGTLAHTVHGNGYKYGAINVGALGVHGTLEFRSLRTPAEPERINTWIDALVAIKDYALKIENPCDLVERCSVLGAPNLLRDVLGRELADEFTNPYIDDMLMEGARRVQTLAYTQLGEPKKVKTAEEILGREVARLRMMEDVDIPIAEEVPTLDEDEFEEDELRDF